MLWTQTVWMQCLFVLGLTSGCGDKSGSSKPGGGDTDVSSAADSTAQEVVAPDSQVATDSQDSAGADDEQLADDIGSATLGASQIGIGRAHDPAWVTHLGGAGDDQGEGLAVLGDAIYIGGDTSSSWLGTFADPCTATGDHEGEDCADAFLYNATTGIGIQFGGPASDSIKSLAATDDALYVASKYREGPAGNYQTDAVALKYSLDLQTREWEVTIRNAGKVDEFLSIVSDGDVFAAGGSAGKVGSDPKLGDEDMVVMRITPAGTTTAVEQLGSQKFEEMMGVAADADGVYAVGQTSAGLDDDPGGFIGGATDAFLVIMDRSLDSAKEVCRVQIGTKLRDVAQTVVVLGDFVYLGGYTEGVMNGQHPDGAACNQDSFPPTDDFKNDAWIAKYDKTCQHVWTRQFGTKDGDAASKIATDGQRLFVTGIYGSATVSHGGTSSSTHAFVRAYDLDGNVLGEVSFDSSLDGAGGLDIGQSVAVDATYVYVTGSTGGTLGEPGSSLGGRDVFFAKIPIAELTSGVATTGTGCP